MDKPMCPECRNSKRLHFPSFEKGYGRVDSYYPCPKCTEEPVDDRVQEFILDGTGETDPKNVQVRGDLIINFLRTHFKPPTAKENVDEQVIHSLSFLYALACREQTMKDDRIVSPRMKEISELKEWYRKEWACKSAVREANRIQKGE